MLRFARSEDKVSIEDMLSYCFPTLRTEIRQSRADALAGKKPDETPEEKQAAEEKLQWVLLKEERDGSIGQHLEIVQFDIQFDGAVQKMGGIACVASLPEHRYGGGVLELMKWSLVVMKERGIAFSELGPFSYPFYRKCGWELGFRWHEMLIPVSDLDIFKSDSGTFAPLAKADYKEAIELRNSHISRYNGGEYNSPDVDDFFDEDRTLYGVRAKDGTLEGYASFYIEDRRIICRDLFYGNHAAKRKMLHFFYKHNSQADVFMLTVPEDDTLHHILKDQRIEVKCRPGMMVRLVDVKSAVSAMSINSGVTGELIIQIADDFAPWNQGIWLFEAKDGQLSANLVDNSDPDCSITIQRLSQLVYGFISGSEAMDSDMLSWNNDTSKELFGKIFTKRPTAQWIPF